MDPRVRENLAKRRFELALSSDVKAATYYRVDDDGRVVLIHTEIPEGFEGQGLGTRLAAGLLDLIRRSERKIVPRCPFMSAFIETHPEYADLVAD